MGFLSQLSSSLAVLTELTVIRCALVLARNHGSAPKVNTDCIVWQVQERIYKPERRRGKNRRAAVVVAGDTSWKFARYRAGKRGGSFSIFCLRCLARLFRQVYFLYRINGVLCKRFASTDVIVRSKCEWKLLEFTKNRS